MKALFTAEIGLQNGNMNLTPIALSLIDTDSSNRKFSLRQILESWLANALHNVEESR